MRRPHPEHRLCLKANAASASIHYPFQGSLATHRHKRPLEWISLRPPRLKGQPAILRQHAVSLILADCNIPLTLQIQVGNWESARRPPAIRRCRKVRRRPHPEHRHCLKANATSTAIHYPGQSASATHRQRKRRTLEWHPPRLKSQPAIIRKYAVSRMFADCNVHLTLQIQVGNGESARHPPATQRSRKVRQARTHRRIKKRRMLPSWCVASPAS
jgi:hypothetical protein